MISALAKVQNDAFRMFLNVPMSQESFIVLIRASASFREECRSIFIKKSCGDIFRVAGAKSRQNFFVYRSERDMSIVRTLTDFRKESYSRQFLVHVFDVLFSSLCEHLLRVI